jgi:exopolyphosphatase/pppGpp-phosphohydrolase
VDVIGAGALILDRIMTTFGFTEVLVSEHDILDGIAWSLIPKHQAGPSPLAPDGQATRRRRRHR